ALAMRGDIQTLAFLFLRHTQAHDQLDDVEGYEGDHSSPDEYHGYRLRLNEELRPDARIAGRALDPVDRLAGPTEGRGVEDASGECTEDSAESMHAEHVERVVSLDHLLQAGDAPEAHHTNAESDDKGARDTNVTCRGSDRDQTGNGTRGRAQHGRLTLDQP